MSDVATVIEIVDYKPFPQPLKLGAVGIVYGKIRHGLTTNFFSRLVYPFDLNADGYPTVGVAFALGALRYSASSEVLVAVQFLQGHGWFDKEIVFSVQGVDPYDEICADGWAEVWNHSARIDLMFYLEDVCDELEASGEQFSQEWYYAKIANLYFSDIETPDVAMTIGILFSQLWWKVDLEGVAERGQANVASLEKATKSRKARSIDQSRAKNEVIVRYWFDALREFGAETMQRDSNAAQAIYYLASKARPKELLIKSTGEVIRVDAIRKRVSAMRRLKKIG